MIMLNGYVCITRLPRLGVFKVAGIALLRQYQCRTTCRGLNVSLVLFNGCKARPCVFVVIAVRIIAVMSIPILPQPLKIKPIKFT